MNWLVLILIWTFVLYWVHRVAHIIPFVKEFHFEHHRYISTHKTSWHWSNLFLFNDTWVCTVDYWITEVIPTILIAWLFDAPWIFVCYYIWAAFLQEAFEHNKKFDLYPFTSGKWHMIHHNNASKNFGIFVPVWDKLFRTEKYEK